MLFDLVAIDRVYINIVLKFCGSVPNCCYIDGGRRRKEVCPPIYHPLLLPHLGQYTLGHFNMDMLLGEEGVYPNTYPSIATLGGPHGVAW